MPAQIAALAARVKADFPRLDVLMNNAGIMLHKNLTVPAADLAGLMAEMNINVGVIWMTSVFIEILTANKGTVINTPSRFASCRCHLRQSTPPPRRQSTPLPSHCGSSWTKPAWR